ncbi:ABC transporter substrate-binding protein [Nocardioides sp. zg-DK7169]|uniref:ABC transporter substrate-binding protein n=1 Tax=Nocardioides sp. zg-DK7169 TaxID=2736600 RepID=UPI001554A213|nr:ABC transporter substrate-binding protein [Nocardioides sp. zg-DK7169]NPC96699.1 ABC transporter substrate-binding protein [Nocardioides sp. zg-DK7169]
MKRRRNVLRPAVVLVAALALVAGCASDSSDEGSGGDTEAGGRFEYSEGMVGGEDAGGEPKTGGQISYALYSEPRSLDPAVSIAAVTTGGAEMAALYDVLLRYDTDTREFAPQLAESIKANGDNTEWTLTLRDGVSFSDGTPLDAAAVKASQERYAAAPAPEAALWNDNVAGIEVADQRTVVYSLNKPWAMFPAMLASGPGMIVAKSSGPVGEGFTPVGAGPFTLVHQRPSEEVLVEANEDYWNGRPHLDEVRFVYLGDQATVEDSFNNGSLDLAFFRDPDVVDAVLEEGTRGYSNLVAVSDTALINGTEGRPGADVRVRQAIQLALAPDLVRQRVYDGHGMASTLLFPEYSRWYSEEMTGIEPDQDAARELLEEAKADGYDGAITYLDAQTSAARDTAQVVKASLEAVGFEVEIEMVPTVTDLITRLAAERDYDLAGWGINYREGDPFSKLYASLHSTGTQTYGMPTTPEMDAALEEFQGAADEGAQKAAVVKIQEAWNDSVPFLAWMPMAELTAWSDEVHGVKGAANSIVLLDEAWLG